jgi:PAS domain S-box-containing protein
MGVMNRGASRLRFETRALVYLLLLVLLVVVLGAGNLVLTRSARAEAEAAERWAMRKASDAALLRLGEESVVEALNRPETVPGHFPSSRLDAWARRHGLEGAALLARDGTILSGTPPLRFGTLLPGMLALDPGDRQTLGRGRVVIEPRGSGGPRWLFHPLRSSDGTVAGLVATAHRSTTSPRLERLDRVFVRVQIAGLVLAAVLSILFLRFVLRPYRLLARVAGGQAATGTGEGTAPSDPDDLVEHFRGVLGKLREQEDELRRLHTAPDAATAGDEDRIARGMTSAVLTLDREGRVRLVNRAAEAMLGVDGEGLRGRPVEDALEGIGPLGDLARDCLRTGQARSREVLPFQRPGGAPGHLGASLSPILGEGGRVEGALCLLTDLTEIRHLQERVRLKENLATLGELSAGVAHEFRNSLATTLGLARLVERRPGDAGAVTEAARGIVREVNQVREVVDQFLTYARPRPLNRVPVDLWTLLEEVAEGLHLVQGEGRQVTVELEGDLPVVQGDEALLRQAFTNLLRNAGEAGEDRPVRVQVTGVRRGDRVEIRFADDGPGFTPEALETAFVPFATSKRHGTGLGLPIVQKTIVQHDGEISLVNREGGGGEVRLVLPVGF